MNNNNLPTDDLKKYGIINENNSFSKKLSEKDVENFLKGDTIIAENEDKRATFQLENNKLNVNFYHLDKSLDQILEQAKEKPIQYAIEREIDKENKVDEKLNFKAFIYDENQKEVKEYDFVKNAEELTQKIAERKDAAETNRYKNELLKLKDFLQDKIDKFPEIAKEISNDINIVSKTINTIDDLTPNEKQAQQQEKTNVQLNVNDPDLYQDANQEREEDWEESQEQERKRGFRR